MKPGVTVLLVEDHPMFRDRLAWLISREENMTVCGEADNVEEALGMAESLKPSLAILDISLRGSNGLDFLKQLKARNLDFPVLVLSMHDEAVYAERALRAGAQGYITKNEAASEVMAAIEQVLKGEVYLSREMTARMLGRLRGENRATDTNDVSVLSDREFDVFKRIGRAQTTREIAAALRVGLATIETYRTRIKEKLGVKTAMELQRRATLWIQENAG
jgi:DNA-binding NarL/FixJ family response regulator